MNKPDYVYVTYVKTTPERLWEALTSREFLAKYWGEHMISDWKAGSEWRYLSDDDGETLAIAGTILESDPPRRLRFTWNVPGSDVDCSTVDYALEPVADMVRLTVTHGAFLDGSTLPEKISGGWPRVLSSLKSLLETGEPLDTFADHVRCAVPATR